MFMSKKKKSVRPGRSYRKGMTFMELIKLFPDAETAEEFFEAIIWGSTGRTCGHCDAVDTVPTKTGKPAKYRCRTCRKHFNIKTGTFLHGTRLPLHYWIYAMYFLLTNLKGVASMKIYRELGIKQDTAWFMMHRIREAMHIVPKEEFMFSGEVEVDETYVGGKEGNRHAKDKLRLGRGSVGKKAVIGARHRETGLIRTEVIHDTTRETLHGFIKENVKAGSQIYTDEAHAYKNLPDYKHKSVKHSAGEFVNKMASTNGIESHWSMVKRGYIGVYHFMSFKHLPRYEVASV